VVTPTPLQLSDRLSAITGATVYLKREDLQVVRSYKLRGAYNLLVQLSEQELAAGVVCSSAGNHAQGFAYACRSLGVHGRVYVPAKTPKQKRDRIRYHGGDFIELIVGGATYDLAAAAALDDVKRTGATLVPPYDDLRTIAGQGTIAVELLAQLGPISGEPDLVVVPVGGGGCIAGITTYLAERTANTAVLGIEPAGAAAMMAALAAGEPVTLDHVDQFVDGAAVARAGGLTYSALAAAGDMVSITTVDEGAVCTAMLDLYQNEGIIAEPAGALSVAGLLEADVEPGSTVVCLISGGNNDVSRYGEVQERSLIHLGLKHYFLVDFPQEPGALRRFLGEVLGPNDDITLFEYVKRNNRETGEALVGIQLGSAADLDGLLARMRATEMHVETLHPGSPAYRYLLL
jgi:threonine dehydratase